MFVHFESRETAERERSIDKTFPIFCLPFVKRSLGGKRGNTKRKSKRPGDIIERERGCGVDRRTTRTFD